MKKQKLIEINDIYYINDSFKKSSEHLAVFYNLNSQKYELHDLSQKNSFVISYDKYPDEGFLVKYYRTKVENIAKTLKEIDNFNEKLTQNKNNLICDKSDQQLKEVISFALKKGDGDLTASQIRNIVS